MFLVFEEEFYVKVFFVLLSFNGFSGLGIYFLYKRCVMSLIDSLIKMKSRDFEYRLGVYVGKWRWMK